MRGIDASLGIGAVREDSFLTQFTHVQAWTIRTLGMVSITHVAHILTLHLPLERIKKPSRRGLMDIDRCNGYHHQINKHALETFLGRKQWAK